MMILFHILFDLYFFGIRPVNVISGFWRYFGFATASLFLTIAGISLSVSHARAVQSVPALTEAGVWIKFLKRGAFIFACGLLVTLATFLYPGEGFVVFGILQVIGVSIMISPLFFRFGRYNLLLGAAVIVTGISISLASFDGPLWLLPLGIHPDSFRSLDYEPIFPWSGLVLMGMGLGDLAYPGGRRRGALSKLLQKSASPLAALGRHSLLIYLVHQPVILLALQVVTGQPIFR